MITIYSLAFLTINCYLHHANVSGDFYGAKNAVSFHGTEIIKSLPIKIDFEKTEKDYAISNLKKKGQNVEFDPILIEGYYSDEIISNFKSSNLFNYTPNANIKIRIYSEINEIRSPVITFLPNILTLGLFPAITRTYGRVEFELFDESSHTIIKTFKYPISHRIFTTVTAVILGPILPIFSHRFDHSQNERTFAIMRVAFKQFEIDLRDELISDKNLLSKFTIEKPGTYALMPMSKIEKNVSEIYHYLYSELESAFIQRGLKLVERNKLDRVFEEINFSKTGLTENSRNEIGSLLNAERLIILTDLNLKPNTNSKLLTDFSFSISCVDSKTGEIIWSENVDHQSSIGKSLTQNVQSAISLFISKLRSRGHI